MFRLYSVSFAGLLVPSQQTRVDAKMSELGDWIRVNHVQWVIWTDKTKVELQSAVEEFCGVGVFCVIFVIQTESAAGWAPQWIWDWINNRMTRLIRGAE